MDVPGQTLAELIEKLRTYQPIEGIVTQESMLPTLRPGQRVRLEPFRKEEARVGDIVAYRRGERLIIHRIVGIDNRQTGRSYLLKGDANFVCDAPVLEEEVLTKALLERDRFPRIMARVSLWEARIYSLLKKFRSRLPRRVPFAKILMPLRPIRLLTWFRH